MADNKLLVEVQLLTCAVPIIAEVGQRIMVLGTVAVGVDTSSHAPPPKALTYEAKGNGKGNYIRRSRKEVDAHRLHILKFCKEPHFMGEIRTSCHDGTTRVPQLIKKLVDLKFLNRRGYSKRYRYQTTKRGLEILAKGNFSAD